MILVESMILVGRATNLQFKEYESGATLASFMITVNNREGQEDFSIFCEGYGKKIAEAFETMDEGSLVSIIGKYRRPKGEFPAKIQLDRLEVLGKAKKEVANA